MPQKNQDPNNTLGLNSQQQIYSTFQTSQNCFVQYKTWQPSKSYFVQSWHNAWVWQTDWDTAQVPPVRIQTHASHHGGKHSHEVEIKCSLRFLKAVLPLNKCNNWVSEAASHTEQRRYEVRLCLCPVSAACLLRCFCRGVKHNGVIARLFLYKPISFR